MAIGLISGGATVDRGLTDIIAAREKEFSLELVSKSIRIKVQEAKASKDEDRVPILNIIAGTNLNDNPPEYHAEYEAVNDALRSIFVSSIRSLQSALSSSDAIWCSVLDAISKGTKPLNMMFAFAFEEEVGRG